MTILPSGRYYLVTPFSCFSTSDTDTIDPHDLPLLTDIFLVSSRSVSFRSGFFLNKNDFKRHKPARSLSHRLSCSLTHFQSMPVIGKSFYQDFSLCV